jgi:hypothetical protein
MKEKSILFSAPMVRAILEGRKTVTRRLVDLKKMKPEAWKLWDTFTNAERAWTMTNNPEVLGLDNPYPIGLRLWVKENFWIDIRDREARVVYAATPETGMVKKGRQIVTSTFPAPADFERQLKDSPHWKLRPSIFLWRWACRIELEVQSVSAEQLQDISEEDAQAEGVKPYCEDHNGIQIPTPAGQGEHQASFRHLWGQINGEGSWNANPWIRAVGFRRVDEKEKA